MKLLTVLFFLILSSLCLSKSIKDYPYYSYDVFFTNPICKVYKYEKEVLSNDGDRLLRKPGTYCKKSDQARNESLKGPHQAILNLINKNDLSKLFISFLSFSNHSIGQALCVAAQRGVDITVVIDSNNMNRDSGRRQLDLLSNCTKKKGKVETLFRGNVSGLGYAHNKVILAQFAKDSDKRVIVFGSANLSSGTSLHHENWHFISTSKKTYFYQGHLCLKEAILEAKSKKTYKSIVKNCRSKINTVKENDIELFIVPSDGKLAMKNIVDSIKTASKIDGAAHRLFHPEVIDSLAVEASNKEIRFLLDDDIYWSGILKKSVGSSMYREYFNAFKMFNAGVKVKYVETNQNSRLLFHNKYLIFTNKDETISVHTGAGNFTKAAFTKNLENFYFIKIPQVTKAFKDQYEWFYNEMATDYLDMPAIYANP